MYIFTPNTLIKSAEINANFAEPITNAKLDTSVGELGGAWQTWTPTITGFSANPTGGIYRYKLIGKLIIVSISMPNAGTSNATTLTITAPFTAATITNMIWSASGTVVDNTSTIVLGSGRILPNENIINFYTGPSSSNVWTASGTKRVAFLTIIYEVA